ncbi:MAG: C-terminal binding protein [Desulfobacteraceae bacterium]|nr:MAG: C-terminal binding protein [Desulfobacteraceae bacterium]
MSKYKVAVVSLGYESYETERGILSPLGVELVLAARDCLTEQDVIEVAAGSDGILVREAPIGAKVLDTLERLKVVARYGVGVDNIDLKRAREKKIYVANVPGYGTEEVSDHAVALLLACVRRLLVRDRNLREGMFETDIRDRLFRTTGKVLGLIGYGQIGRAFHRKWKGFLPSRVLVFDPYARESIARERDLEVTDLDTLLSESDYISIHAPLTPETKHMIDERAFQKMKETAVLVNTSRGELVDEKALVKALQEQRILGAGIDVFEKEPIEKNHPLLALPNAVLTGHVGWYSKDAVRELQTRAAKEIARVFQGQTPECWVNRWGT